PVESIGDEAGHERERDLRDELAQADEPERERIVRDAVELPRHRDALHLHRDEREHPRRLVQGERTKTQERARGDVAGGLVSGHFRWKLFGHAASRLAQVGVPGYIEV